MDEQEVVGEGDAPATAQGGSAVLSGRETLASIDEAVARMRGELDALDTHFQEAGAALANVRRKRVALYAQLAKMRLAELARGALVPVIDATERQVGEILAERRAALEALGPGIAAQEQTLAARERERARQQSVADAAVQAVDAAEAEAQRRLGADGAYQQQLAGARRSDAIADQAEAKAQAAETDRREKGRPYEADPVFVYLWRRGYGTSRYRAWPVARLLDGWVARSSGYETLRRNYALLTEIPRRLADHAQRMRAAAEREVEALRAIESRAAAAAGVPERRSALETAEQALERIDAAIEEQEAVVDRLIERRTRFAAGEDEYSKRAAEVLAQAYQREELESLHQRAARTGSGEDDRVVDELDRLDDEYERLQQELTHYRRLHQAQRERTLGLEEVRRRFKRSRYDDMHSVFVNGALIDALLDRFLVGSIGIGQVWDGIRQQQRYRGHAADPFFGSGGFPRRMPMPSPWRMPGRGGWNFPRGGGFGGGGFRTGGGLGGGGFRTGGGF